MTLPLLQSMPNISSRRPFRALVRDPETGGEVYLPLFESMAAALFSVVLLYRSRGLDLRSLDWNDYLSPEQIAEAERTMAAHLGNPAGPVSSYR